MVKDCETSSYEERLEAQGTFVWTKEITQGICYSSQTIGGLSRDTGLRRVCDRQGAEQNQNQPVKKKKKEVYCFTFHLQVKKRA